MNPINPIIFQLGPFQVRWYGVLIMTGVAIGAYFASRLVAKRGANPEHIWSALILAVVVAIVGARLYHVFSTPADCPLDATYPCGWPYYKDHFLEAFMICLLYTSDAADDLLCVDLGGRRSIKKKKTTVIQL